MSGPAHPGPDIADDGSVPARLAALRRQGFARAEPLRKSGYGEYLLGLLQHG